MYKEFYGKNIEQMPKLISEGLKPMTIKDIIKQRLDGVEYFKNNWFDSCDMVVCFNDKFKIVKDCNILKSMNSNTKLKDRGIELSENQYKELKGKEFKKDCPKEEVWKYLIEDLYEDYIKMLGFCPDYYLSFYELSGRSFFVSWLGDSRSCVDGRLIVDFGSGRLVGVASEVRVKKVKVLKSIPTEINYKGNIYVLKSQAVEE